jgi:hypothetical protein
MRFSFAIAMLLSAGSLLLLNASAGTEEMPNPAKMPVPKSAAPQPAPPVLPQGQNARTLLKYKGEPMSSPVVTKPTQPAPMVSPSKL